MAPRDVEECVIVAENDGMMRGLLRTALAHPGRSILLCADGLEALELASQTIANLVLLDLKMPRMDGIEACQRIRELPCYAAVPIVVLTVFDGGLPKQRALRAGASAFLRKPISRSDLLAVVNPLIDAQKQQPELERY